MRHPIGSSFALCHVYGLERALLRSASVWNHVRMVELLIMRHAKSDWGSSSLPDFDRPLSRRGQRVANMMTAWLDSYDLEPDRGVSSAAVREQTEPRVLICGHNPGFDSLVQCLSADSATRTGDGKLMTTAAIARFSFDRPWPDVAPGTSSLISLTRPAELDS